MSDSPTVSAGRNYGRLARFGVFALVSLTFAGFVVGILNFLMVWGVQAWFTDAFGDHRIHQIIDGAAITLIVVGTLVGLYYPLRRVAVTQTVVLLAVLVALVGTAALGALSQELAPFLVFGVLLGVLHPAGREFLRPFTAGQFSPRLAALGVVALVPLGLFAAGQFGLQATLTDEHALFGHWGNMAALSVGIGLLALLASLKTRSWLFPAIAAGALAAIQGLASVLFVEASSVGPMWGGLELLWAVAFVAVAVAEHRGLIGERSEEPTVVEPADD